MEAINRNNDDNDDEGDRKRSSSDKSRSPAASAKTRKKRRVSIRTSSQEDRTPKRLQCMEPDLTVVVGGVEFYHYKCVLCLSCDFFDRMLSSQMREQHTSRIELPDKNPDEWLQVYEFLDTTGHVQSDTDVPAPVISGTNALLLLPWFDFLGLQQLVVKCDAALAHSLNYKFYSPQNAWDVPRVKEVVDHWETCQALPCPKTKDAITLLVCHAMDDILGKKPQEKYKDTAPYLKQMLLDEECGKELWDYCLLHVRLPKAMVQDLSRQEIIQSPLFDYIMEDYAKRALLGGANGEDADEENRSSSESSMEHFVGRPLYLPQNRNAINLLDDSSDSDSGDTLESDDNDEDDD